MANITINIAQDLKKKAPCAICLALFVLQTWMIPQTKRLAEERCAVIFLRDQTYDFHLMDNKLGEKQPLPKTL